VPLEGRDDRRVGETERLVVVAFEDIHRVGEDCGRNAEQFVRLWIRADAS
jgi:hypothetical protein